MTPTGGTAPIFTLGQLQMEILYRDEFSSQVNQGGDYSFYKDTNGCLASNTVCICDLITKVVVAPGEP